MDELVVALKRLREASARVEALLTGPLGDNSPTLMGGEQLEAEAELREAWAAYCDARLDSP